MSLSVSSERPAAIRPHSREGVSVLWPAGPVLNEPVQRRGMGRGLGKGQESIKKNTSRAGAWAAGVMGMGSPGFQLGDEEVPGRKSTGQGMQPKALQGVVRWRTLATLVLHTASLRKKLGHHIVHLKQR